jgi:hypothetical protein
MVRVGTTMIVTLPRAPGAESGRTVSRLSALLLWVPGRWEQKHVGRGRTGDNGEVLLAVLTGDCRALIGGDRGV